MWFTKRLIATLGTFILFVLAVLTAQNIESISEYFGTDAIGIEGPPPAWRAWAMSVFGNYVAPAATYVAGPFGLGFVLAAVLFSLPDMRAVVQRYRTRRAERAASDAIGKSGQRIAAEQQALELLRQFMLTDMSCLLSDLEKLNRHSLAELGADHLSTEAMVRLARVAIVDDEEQKYYSYSRHFAYDKRDVNLQDLQNALCNYLTEYLNLVRSSHDLMAPRADEIKASEPYRKWKKGDTDALLRLRKISEHRLLNDLAIFLHRREFSMGQEHYRVELLGTELDAARAHRP